jgi:methyl-accepting chemotaxis protein
MAQLDAVEEKLLKELLQKKLYGTLSAAEDVILGDLSRKRQELPPRSAPPSDHLARSLEAMGDLMQQIGGLNNSLDEMANKIQQRRSTADARYEISEKDKK